MSIVCNDEGIYQLSGFDKLGMVLRRLDDVWVPLPDGPADGENAESITPHLNTS